MKLSSGIKLFTLALCSNLSFAPAIAAGDDIDIFTGASGGVTINPRVLIIIDNSSNWSAEKQHWPVGTQGQAEMQALYDVVGALNSTISVGLMAFNSGAGAKDGGYIRSAIRPMNAGNKTFLQTELAELRDNYKAPAEKTASNIGYGNIMRDAYSYLTGGNAYDPDGVVTSLSDGGGYKVEPRIFDSPVTEANSCGKTFIIFIGNNGSLNADSSAARLKELSPTHTFIETVPKFASSTYKATEPVGITNACYSDEIAAKSAILTQFAAECTLTRYPHGCAIDKPVVKSPDICVSGESAYSVKGTYDVVTNVEVAGTDSYVGRNSDDWALFMAEKGIPVAGSTIRPSVTTYTIDVYKDNNNEANTGIMMNMAKHGRGRYFKATSKEAIMDALETITSEIQAVNSAFASTSLPVNATNRSQNQNQVFIGMFRPDAKRRPRWFGNLKKYQLVFSGGTVDLGDATRAVAVNNNTGFMSPCARSFWSKDSASYWNIPVGVFPFIGEPVKGNCNTASTAELGLYSDLPDGELVEKGAAAQILRQGNSPTAAADSRALNRKILTMGSTGLVPFDGATEPAKSMDAPLMNWVRGSDINNEKKMLLPTEAKLIAVTRPSIHGDVIHSRPLPVTYGADSVVVYYGANDGALHAVDAATGVENWSFVESNLASKLARLKDNSPLVSYAGQDASHAKIATPKDYFFDGSIGLYQNAADADPQQIWIYPAMRRGGRRIYSLDVTLKTDPKFQWRLGCTEVGDNDVCDTGMEKMGQSWSAPAPFFVKGYALATAATPAVGTTPAKAAQGPKPAVIFGGGYDKCEDIDAKITNQCVGKTGQSVYIRKGDTGEALATFTPLESDTPRSFAADIAMVDIDNDGYVDYAYAADTGGGLWRINFIDNPTSKTALEPVNWRMVKVAQSTLSEGRKFLFQPALLYTAKQVYIAIGSGDREHPLEMQYPFQQNVKNRFYVFKDDLSVAVPSVQALDSLDNAQAATCNTIGTTPSSISSKGWYLDLENGRGEQTVTSALIAGGMVAFSTNRPHGGETGTCATTLGHAHGYWLNLFTGSGAIKLDGTCGGNRSSEFVGGGLPPSPVLATSVPVIRNLADGKTRTEFITVAIGTVSKTGLEANVPFKPVQVSPKVDNRRKRSYTYSSTD